jgi:hypothetical protein
LPTARARGDSSLRLENGYVKDAQTEILKLNHETQRHKFPRPR